jgi:hypothetical protein
MNKKLMRLGQFFALLRVNILRKKFSAIPLSHPEIGVRVLEFIPKGSKVFEWGTGVSTYYLGTHSGCSIVSIESSKSWANVINQIFLREGLSEICKVIFINIGPTKSYGTPIKMFQRFNKSKFKNYWEVANQFKSFNPEVVLIDGRFRILCALESLTVFKPPFTLIIDDYTLRPSYNILSTLLGDPVLIDRSAIFKLTRNCNNQENLQITILKEKLRQNLFSAENT